MLMEREEVWARKYGQNFAKRSGRGLLAASEGEVRPRKIVERVTMAQEADCKWMGSYQGRASLRYQEGTR